MSYHDRMLEIARQRERLLMRCETQRMDLAFIARQSGGAIKVIDRVIGVVSFFRSHPLMLGAAAASLAVIQHRSWWGWVQRAFMLWRAYRALNKARFTFKA